MKYLHRHIEKQILESAKYFKAILLLGARQTGKSTLLSHLFPQVKTFVFDPLQDVYKARQDPDLFLESFPAPLILDEVQCVPELLNSLKRKMDRSDAKGQYFLTGSQNFSILRNVAESMAGRVAIFHLDHLSPQELLGKGNDEGWLPAYLKDPDSFYLKRDVLPSTFSPLVEFLFRGTFPATVELPTSQIPRYMSSYLQTYVDRDVRTMENIQNLTEFNRFLGIIAALTAQEINASQLGREIGVSPQTARRWLDLLSYTYQWFELFPYHGNTIKRISGKKKGYFKDPGFACYLQAVDSYESLAKSPKLGAIFETWAINYIIQQSATLDVPPKMYHWRTSAGAEVDLILERTGKLYPIEFKCKTHLSRTDLSGLKAFRATYSKQEVMPGLIFYAGSEAYKLDENTLALPWNLL
ncbi:MAG: GTP-binding protein [Parachlamydiales bacterium]|nr:GTP-binding protein [Parachlamydiales bacterium]